jgi:intein/homing endonuclease
MKIIDIKEELIFCYKEKLNDFLGKDINECDEKFLREKFNDHTKFNIEKIKIKDLIDNFQNSAFLLNTPDGMQEVGDFYIKGPKPLKKITTVDDFYTKCSDDHKLETPEGWKFAKDISKKDLILTKNGFRKVSKIEDFDPEEVYDFEVLHDNHRYWSGNGLSSHNSGKTYLALSICRNAQAMGYSVIYYDSEGGIDIDFVKRLGVDTKKVRIENISTIEEFATLTAKLNEALYSMREKGVEPPKVMVVLDSLGNLSSSKEKEDTTSGSGKRDMTKQQAIRRTFRVVGNDFAKNAVPFIICNHVYECISGETKILMGDGKTLKPIKDIIIGEEVLSLGGPKEVLDKFEYNVKHLVELEFEDNYVIKCTKDHKFAVEDEQGKLMWKRADDLEENDEILIM